MIIDTSNAPCGPGFLPGLRLSEGRFAINRRKRVPSRLLRGWGGRRRAFRAGLRPPKTRPRDEKGGARLPSRLLRGVSHRRFSGSPRGPAGRGCRRTFSSLADRATAAAPGGKQPRSGGRPARGDGGRPERTRFLRATRASPSLRLSRRRERERPRDLDSFSTTTSDQTRRPAEFKHIIKRRKRN